MSKYPVVIVLMLMVLPLCGKGQETPISVERSLVLSQYGESESVQLSFPIKKGVGVVSSQTIERDASSLRLHFKIESPAKSASWGVEVRNKKNNPVWSYSAISSSDTDFWSDELLGDVAKVEVFSLVEVTDLKLTIDRIIVAKSPTLVKSLTVNKLKPITEQSDQIQDWGKAVARLVFVADANGKQYLCSGFLVSSDIFMTNNHCIQSDSEMRSGLAEFDYNHAEATPVTLRFKELLKTNRDLDFTLLRLATDSGRQPLVIESSAPGEDRKMVIIQHPAGRPKQVSIQNCKVIGAAIAGVTPQLTDFGHGCDTLSGSSGSPALDIGTGKVLGLHHLGFLPNNKPVNRAVRIQQILDFLNQNLSDAQARQALGLAPQ